MARARATKGEVPLGKAKSRSTCGSTSTRAITARSPTKSVNAVGSKVKDPTHDKQLLGLVNLQAFQRMLG